MSHKHLIVCCLAVILCSESAEAQEASGEYNQSNTFRANAVFVPDSQSGELTEVQRRVQAEAKAIAQRDHELAVATRATLATYAKATDNARKEEITEQLRSLVTEHFEVKQALRETQLAELEARVKRLRELHDRRTSAKSTIIEKRAQLLLDEANGLGWNMSSEGRSWNGQQAPRPLVTRPAHPAWYSPAPQSDPFEDAQR